MKIFFLRGLNQRFTMLVLAVFFLSNCKPKRGYIIEYRKLYPNGNLWQLGMQNRDSLFVGTLKIFGNNNVLREMRTYDSAGMLNGYSYLFDSNGRKEYMIYLKNGKPYGYSFTFYPDGNLESKNYYLAKQVGNTYHYDRNGNVDTFSFFDFKSNGLMEKHYQNGQLIRQYYKSYFLDTFLRSDNKEYLNLGFVLARPPHEYVSLTVYKVDEKGRIFDSIGCPATDKFDSIKIGLLHVGQLKIICKRYDSMLNQSTVEDGIINISGSAH